MKSTNSRIGQFTLVEIMAVIVIIALILSIAVPAFNSLATRGSVDAAASMIASQLRLARAEAALRRTEVGIGFFIEESADHSAVSFQARWDDPKTQSTKLVPFPDSKREYLPTGALVELPVGNEGEWYDVSFLPSGRPAGSFSLTILEAVLDPQSRRRMLNAEGEASEIMVNQYTGNVSVEKKAPNP